MRHYWTVTRSNIIPVAGNNVLVGVATCLIFKAPSLAPGEREEPSPTTMVPSTSSSNTLSVAVTTQAACPGASIAKVKDDSSSPRRGVNFNFNFAATVSAVTASSVSTGGTIVRMVSDPNGDFVTRRNMLVDAAICAISNVVACTDTQSNFTNSITATDAVVVVTAPTLLIAAQTAPSSYSVTIFGSSAFADQPILTIQNSSNVSNVTVHTNSHLNVSSSGAFNAVGGCLHIATCLVSGADSDTSVDTGNRMCPLHVSPITITRKVRLSPTVSRALSDVFGGALAVISANEYSVVSLMIATNAHLNVYASGEVTMVGGPLVANTYGVAGTDSIHWTPSPRGPPR